MSNNKLTINSVEFRAALRSLPTDLAHEASNVVALHAAVAQAKISAVYARVAKTGNLQRGLRVIRLAAGQYGAATLLKSTAFHNYLYENGTQGKVRFYGRASRGPMPGAHVFVPTAIRQRKAMEQDLAAIVRRAGFRVTHG